MCDWDISDSNIEILMITLCIAGNPANNPWILLITLYDIADNGIKTVKPKFCG